MREERSRHDDDGDGDRTTAQRHDETLGVRKGESMTMCVCVCMLLPNQVFVYGPDRFRDYGEMAYDVS